MPKIPLPSVNTAKVITAGQSRPELSGAKKYTKKAATLPDNTPIIHHNSAKKMARSAYWRRDSNVGVAACRRSYIINTRKKRKIG